jgi:hypothetical protein
MNTISPQLNAVAGHWLGKISPTLIAILIYIYWKAATSPDGKVGQSIEEIAVATGLAWRTVQPKLHELAALGAIEILSLSVAKERMLIQIPRQYWSAPVNVTKPDFHPPSIPELIFRLCGQRPSPEMLALMMVAADNDELRLQHCLDTFFAKRERWATLDLLTVAVQHDMRPRSYFDGYWTRP